jgi:hypothetical protein
VLVYFDGITGHINGNIRISGVIVDKILFYNMGLIAGQDNKIIVSPMGINFHDMPEYGTPSYFHHGFGAYICFF